MAAIKLITVFHTTDYCRLLQLFGKFAVSLQRILCICFSCFCFTVPLPPPPKKLLFLNIIFVSAARLFVNFIVAAISASRK